MIKYIDLKSGGLHKHWIYKDKLNYELACDYLQKINYSINDYNYTLEHIQSRGDICFLILLVTWIQEASVQIEKIISKDVMANFIYEDEKLDTSRRYLKALRSFVVAHPLDTDKHSKYGLDGNYVCLDISTGPVPPMLKAFKSDGKFFYLSLDGLEEVSDIEQYNYRLHVYSKRENAEFFKYFGCNYSDLETVANQYLKRILTLDKYLASQKRNDYKYV